MDQTLYRMATKEREEIKRTTKQKMARRHQGRREPPDQESDKQTTMEDTDGELHPAVDGQRLDHRRNVSISECWHTNEFVFLGVFIS